MSVAMTEDVVPTVVWDRRSWWRKIPRRMTVRSLMIFVLLLSGLLGWVVHLAHVQRDAVAAIVSGGGQVTYDWELMTGTRGKVRVNRNRRPNAPEWLVAYLGHDFFGHVVHVGLGLKNVDEMIKHVGKLDKVRRLRFSEGIDLSPLASAGIDALPNNGVALLKGFLGLFAMDLAPPEFKGANFKYLQNMTLLEELDLPGNVSATDADLKYLSRLIALTGLELHDPRITDAGLVYLKNLTSLKRLNTLGTQVSGAGLISLAPMTDLEILNLRENAVSMTSSPIGHLKRLTRLDLFETPIDDRGLAPIAGMTGLEHVLLDETHITGRSYAYLKSLPKLSDLWIENTQMGDEGSEALAGLTALTGVYFDNSRITDVTMAHLTGLPNLREVKFGGNGCHRSRPGHAGSMQGTEAGPRGRRADRPSGLRAIREANPHVSIKD